MDFKLSYEDAKKILSVFYTSPYQVSAPFVAILDNIQNEDGQTLRNCIEAEVEAKKEVAAEPEPTE